MGELCALRRMRMGIAMLPLAFWATVVFAQDKILSRVIGFRTQTSEGQFSECGMEFTYIFQDHTYHKGEVAAVNGTIWYAKINGHLVATLKLAGMDFPGGTGQLFAVPSASITIGANLFRTNATPKVLRPNTMPCEKNNGQFCGYFSSEQTTEILLAMAAATESRNGLNLNFNRENGGIDYNFPLDENPDDTQEISKYFKESAANSACMKAIVERTESTK